MMNRDEGHSAQRKEKTTAISLKPKRSTIQIKLAGLTSVIDLISKPFVLLPTFVTGDTSFPVPTRRLGLDLVRSTFVKLFILDS